MKKSYTFTWIGIVICLLGLSPVSYAQAIEITDSAPFFENFNEISSSEENFGLSGLDSKIGICDRKHCDQMVGKLHQVQMHVMATTLKAV